MRIRCPNCREVIAAPRGDDRVRFKRLPIIVVRATDDGQALETMCPACRKDVSIPLPIPPEHFRGQ